MRYPLASLLKPFSYRTFGARLSSLVRASNIGRVSNFAFRTSDFSTAGPHVVSQGSSLKYLEASAPTLLRFRSLAKRYGSVAALAGVDLMVPRGSIVALLGPNGAGKSTLFGCLLGLVHPSAGLIDLNHQPVSDQDRTRFGYVPERIALYPHRTVRENGLFFARLKGRTGKDLQHQLRRVGLHRVQGRAVRQLSKGMLQRLGLAIALCGEPELLVLDEPFNGLDPALLDALQEILREENRRGATLLIATHTMSAVENLATHATILLRGRVAASGSVAELRSSFPGQSLEGIYHAVARQHRDRAGLEDLS